MVNFKQEIAKEIAEVTNLDSKELENYIEIPPNSDLGDYAFPCFKLAKELRKAPPMIANDIKENIKIDEKIIEKGLSIRRLAELADISHTEVKRIEDGLRKQTSPQVLRSIASALGVPYEELMAAAGYIDEPAAESSGGTVAAGIKDTEDLSQDEIDQVNQYIAFLKSQRKD